MPESYKPNREEAINQPENVPVSVELQVYDRLSGFFKNAEIHKYTGSERSYIKIVVETQTEFDQIALLLSLTGVDPWSDQDKLSFTIDNHLDIEDLIEKGVIDTADLPSEILGTLEESLDADMTRYVQPKSKLPELRPIPELFSPKGKISEFDEISEDDIDALDQYSHGDTTFLYKIYKRKYKRLSDGTVYKKLATGIKEQVSEEEQSTLLALGKSGDRDARNEILTMNVGLVYFVALNIGRRFPTINLADLIQEAAIEMDACIDKYIPGLDKGNGPAKFSTFATISMEGALINYISRKSTEIRLPAHAYQTYKNINDITDKLAHSSMTREQLIERIYNALPISKDQAGKLFRQKEYMWKPEYIDIDEMSNNDVHEFYSHDEAPETVFDPEELRRISADAIDSKLTSTQAKVIRLRFGIDAEEHTLEEIGQMFGVSRSRISQIEGTALRILRHPNRSQGLRTFLDRRNKDSL